VTCRSGERASPSPSRPSPPGARNGRGCGDNGIWRDRSSPASSGWRRNILLVIGNDIVDLTTPENRGKSGDRRFRARVCTAAEADWIDASPSPDTALWMLWAAKESAFKAALKLRPGLTFRPREYAVADLTGGTFPGAFVDGPDRRMLRSVTGPLVSARPVFAEQEITSVAASGAVMTPAGLLDLHFFLSPSRVHCLALGGNGRELWEKRIHWQEQKRIGAFDPSRAVRRAAVHYLADALRISPYFLAIRRPRTPAGESGPPQVFLEGRRVDIDISLTHDGSFLAFAVNMSAPSF